MLVETDKIMPITKLQKELTQTVRKLSEDQEPVYIVKNNNMEAVIIPFSQYVFLSNLEELFENLEIETMIKNRLNGYDSEKSISWELIREE